MMKTVVFLGYSNSGKTSAIVSVVKQLVKAGNKVGTLKHIHDEDFTIDTKGKDTWHHAAAGASTVVAVAPKELTVIDRKDTRRLSVDDLMRIFEHRGVDYLLIEGLYRRLSRRRGVVRILCARSSKETAELLKLHPRPVCILDRGASQGRLSHGIPVIRLPRDLPLLMNLIEGTKS